MEKHISGRGLLNLVPKDKQIVGLEIGVDVGDTADFMLSNLPNLKLFGIDPYEGYIDWNNNDLNINNRNFVKERAINTLNQYGDRFSLIETTSDKAVGIFKDEELDYIFIDGLHTYEQVLMDCRNYYSKVKTGGVFAGHDYNVIEGVRKAVQEFAAEVGANILETETDVWYWIKKKINKYYFISYTGHHKQEGHWHSKWNGVINCSPMDFLKRLENDTHYDKFVILSCVEITEEDYNKWKGQF